MTPAPKRCVTCGREMTWRKKWAQNWEEVKYCSEGCRKGVRAGDRRLEAAILELLAERERGGSQGGSRGGGATICPSEVARATAPDDWRKLMEPVRRAARRLAAAGEVEVTQGGKVVDAATARGPIRIRKKRP